MGGRRSRVVEVELRARGRVTVGRRPDVREARVVETDRSGTRRRRSVEPHAGAAVSAEDARTAATGGTARSVVLAGVVVAAVLGALPAFDMIAVADGAEIQDPDAGAAAAPGGLIDVAGVWWILVGVLVAVAGGYTAGRLANRPEVDLGPTPADAPDADEARRPPPAEIAPEGLGRWRRHGRQDGRAASAGAALADPG